MAITQQEIDAILAGHTCECSGKSDEGKHTFECPKWKRTMTQRSWEKCSGNCPANRPCPPNVRALDIIGWGRTEELKAKFPGLGEKRETVAPGIHRTTLETKSFTSGGVGTHLRAVIYELGLGEGSCFECGAMAAWMDSLGVEGCINWRDRILNQLRDSQKKLNWLQKLKAAKNAVLSGLAFKIDPKDPAPALFDEAVRRALKEKT